MNLRGFLALFIITTLLAGLVLGGLVMMLSGPS